MYKAVKACGSIGEFKQQDEKTLMRWAAGILGKNGRRITQRDVELLLTMTGTDMGNIRMELEKIEKTPAAEKTVKAVKKATETVAAKAPEVVEEVKNTVKNHKISGITLEIFETSITVADLEAAVKKDAEAKGLKGKELHIYVNAEERAAYYTADGEGSDDYRIDLTTL